jgi:hypothetical protein
MRAAILFCSLVLIGMVMAWTAGELLGVLK